ncbi:MAG: RIO1 family regulatory kinase/ATPase, partial [Myxococcota bacterium]|nr:RIO1 family regulatory kinase/ATPase [Myxococcota bacterium]
LEAEWQNAEVGALYRLHEAGVRVPIPMHFGDNVLVMELITDGEGNPAPRLWDVRLARDEAIELHRHLVRQVVLMLCAGLVHGDLSEYNILLSGEGPVIIDLPQTTDAAHNRNSERIFLRDVRNLRNYFGRFAPQLRKTRYGPEIWDLYNQGKLHPESPLTGKFKRSSQRADTAGIIAEIQASAVEAGERPMSAYQLKRQKKIEASLAEAERSAAEAEKRALQRAARQQDGPDRKGDRPPRGKGERPPRGKDDRPRRRRRRRRRGGGRGS